MKEFLGAALGGVIGGALVGIAGIWYLIRKVDV